MKKLAALLALGALTACGPPADPVAHAEQRWAVCQHSALPQERVHACSEVVAFAEADPARKAAALMERARQRAALREDVRAIADFGRALRLDASLVDAYLERGQLHQGRGAYDMAVRDYDAALALRPNMPLAIERREAALREREQDGFDDGSNDLDLLTQMLAADPNNAALWNNRCWTRAVAGEELEFALADCNEAIRLQPRYAAALDSRGLVHIKREEYLEAIADYNAALAIEPNYGHYLYGRGIARQRLGQTAAAQADFEAAQRADPGIVARYATYGVTL